MDDTSEVLDKNPEVVREDLITTAVKFLEHPSVQKSTTNQREAFLRKKGLSEKEIRIAFERCLPSLPPVPQFPQQQMSAPEYAAVPMPGYFLPPATTRWGRIREMLHNFAIIGGIIYSLYLLYKKYIAPFLFGYPSKKTGVQESIEALDASVKSSIQELRADLQKVQEDVEKISDQQELSRNHATAKHMQELKSEITSVKGILLNRKTFSTAILDIPSIPAWQMEDDQGTEQKGDEETGSLGSEAEVVTNNGSDSSLEMIKE